MSPSQKLSGHILMLGVAVVVAMVSIAMAGNAFAALPGDEISLLSAFGYAIWLGLMCAGRRIARLRAGDRSSAAERPPALPGPSCLAASS